MLSMTQRVGAQQRAKTETGDRKHTQEGCPCQRWVRLKSQPGRRKAAQPLKRYFRTPCRRWRLSQLGDAFALLTIVASCGTQCDAGPCVPDSTIVESATEALHEQ